MQSLNSLPPVWQPAGEPRCPAIECALDLLEEISETHSACETILSQLGDAPDISDPVRDLGVQLRQQIAQVLATATSLQSACC